MYSNAIDDATGKNDKNISTTKKSTTSSSENLSKKTFGLHDTVKQNDGQEIKVNDVRFTDSTQYTTPKPGNQFIIVNVTLTNNGKKSISYNPYDFKLDDNGNQTHFDAYAGTDDNGNAVVSDDLNSGALRPGASVTGSLVGEGNTNNDIKLVSVDYDNEINWTTNLK